MRHEVNILYLPSDDSIFLSNVVNQYHGVTALEIGTNSGIILRELLKNFSIVVGTDIDFYSLRHVLKMSRNERVICCDAAAALGNIIFDMIVFNPPYLPTIKNHSDKTTDGGSSGIEVSIHFLLSAIDKLSSNGKILMMVSTLSDIEELDTFIVKNNLIKKEIAQKDLFYETLKIIEISAYA